MTVAYDGSTFHGFAHNRGVRTVGGVLAGALSQVLQHPVKLACAGRTDRGVHARAQVVSFEADAHRVEPARLIRSINRMCGPDIAVSDARVVPGDFDARHSCVGRVYRYRILNTAVAAPLLARFSWHVEKSLDLEALRAGARLLVGVHDFSSFCRRKPLQPGQSLVREVRRAVWWREIDSLMFEIEASAFCHQMVRSIVALLVAVGSGARAIDDVPEIIAARDRSATPSPAPPNGLTLWSALYP